MEQFASAVASAGGMLVVSGGNPQVIEGDRVSTEIVLAEFGLRWPYPSVLRLLRVPTCNDLAQECAWDEPRNLEWKDL